MRVDALEADAVEVADGCGESDRRSDRLRARLEPLRRGEILRTLERHGRDHRPAGEERRHRLEHVGAAVEAADAVGAHHLVAAEGSEVDAQRGQVEGKVGGGLAGIHHRARPDFPRECDELLDGVDDAEHVRDVRERDDAGALADELGGGAQVEGAALVRRDVPNGRARAGGELLPRDEVRVMLDRGRDDLVAGAEAQCCAERVRGEVEAHRGAARPDELLGSRPDEARHCCAGVFEQVGGLRGERVRAPVHGGVRVREEVALGIQNGARTLARRAGVEVDERMPVHLLGEDREVLLQRGGIERVGRRGGGGLGGRGRHPSRLRPVRPPGAGHDAASAHGNRWRERRAPRP